MISVIKKILFSLLFMSALLAGMSSAFAQITHVSINQQLFGLGDYPKLKMNIVGAGSHYDKMQFIVRQQTSDERLMVKPINSFMLLITGVEDVVDAKAQLIVKEYRVNAWYEVKTFDLFDEKLVAEQVKAEAAGLKTVSRSKPPIKHAAASAAAPKLTAVSGPLIEQGCRLEYPGASTLWRIGTQYAKEWNLSTYGAVMAIFEANPNAFSQGKIGGLRADVTLGCPSQAVRDRYVDGKLAKQTFEAL